MWLLAGDPHLSDRPRDAYRFKLFSWLRKQQLKYKPSMTFILGDLTVFKDNHPSTLVNKIVDGLRSLAPPVVILKGNHDYIDEANPFFKFLNQIQGIRFVIDPMTIKAGDASFGFVPHCRVEADFVAACAKIKGADAVLLHQTLDGAIAESGVRLGGFSAAPVSRLQPRLGVFAGDVHKPQRAGPVTYIGAPYNVRFGDNFEPRVLLLSNDGKRVNLYPDGPRKWSLQVTSAQDITKNPDLLKGDQVIVTLTLNRYEAHEWREHKQAVLDACKALGLETYGVDIKVNSPEPVKKGAPAQVAGKDNSAILNDFCAAEKLAPRFREAGLELLKNV